MAETETRNLGFGENNDMSGCSIAFAGEAEDTPSAAPWGDPTLRRIGEVFAAEHRRHTEANCAECQEGRGVTTEHDATAGPPHEHEWVLVQGVEARRSSRPDQCQLLWVCAGSVQGRKCTEAKVVEYEV